MPQQLALPGTMNRFIATTLPALRFSRAGLSILVALLQAFSVAAHAADSPGPLRVGLIAPLSGDSADVGNSMRRGVELAAKEINEAGGYLGRPLELVVRDDAGTPSQGREAAEQLVLGERVAFTIGFCNTGVAMKALEVFEQHKHVLLVPCAQGVPVTSATPAALSFVFRVAPSDAMNARFLVREMVVRRKLTKVALLADATPYGDGGVNDVTAELARLGQRPVRVDRLEAGRSPATALRAARDAGAEAIVVYAVGPGQVAALKARSEMKWKVPYFAPWPLSFGSVAQHADPEALDGTMMAQTVIQDGQNERRATFIARYQKYAQEPRIGSLMAAAQGYDATQLALRAVFQARGDLSGPSLKRALENMSQPHHGVVTTYVSPFSATDHEAFSENMIWLGVWRQGRIQFFHAEDAQLSARVRRKHEPW